LGHQKQENIIKIFKLDQIKENFLKIVSSNVIINQINQIKKKKKKKKKLIIILLYINYFIYYIYILYILIILSLFIYCYKYNRF